MILRVDPHSGVPVFRQLMDQIRFHVASGLLGPGEELPSTRSLSARLGVNPMTVSKAFGLLVEEGLIERRPGRPLVVAAQETEEVRADRLAHLRAALAPVAAMVRQLDVDHGEALALFRELLRAIEREAR